MIDWFDEQHQRELSADIDVRQTPDQSRTPAAPSVETLMLREMVAHADAKRLEEPLPPDQMTTLERQLTAELTATIRSAQLLKIEVNQMRAVVEAAREFIAAPRCERPLMSDMHDRCAKDRTEPCEVHRWHMLKHSLGTLDALDGSQERQP